MHTNLAIVTSNAVAASTNEPPLAVLVPCWTLLAVMTVAGIYAKIRQAGFREELSDRIRAGKAHGDDLGSPCQ